MKNVITLLVGFACALCSFEGTAQTQVQIPAKGIDLKVEIQTQQTPIIQAQGVNDKRVPRQKTWIEMEVEFEIKRILPKDAIVPELMFRFYMGMKDEDGKSIVLSGETTYVNVESGEDNFAAAYISPQELYKITGKTNTNANEIAAYGVEVFYNGVLVGFESSTRSKFWQSVSPQVGILGRDQTPFSILWIDRYPGIKKKN